MDFVFLMMRGADVLSVDCVDLESSGETIEQCAKKLAGETGATSYAVLADTTGSVWLLQKTKKIRGESSCEN